MTKLEALARLANSISQVMVDVVAIKSEVKNLNIDPRKARVDEAYDNPIDIVYDLLMRVHEEVYKEIKTLAAKEYMERLMMEKK